MITFKRLKDKEGKHAAEVNVDFQFVERKNVEKNENVEYVGISGPSIHTILAVGSAIANI
jgi:hypothetical protein